jgi:hypothetical protein
MHEEDGSEFFKKLCFISFFCKGWFPMIYDLSPFSQEIDIPLIKDIDPLWFSNFVSQPLATHGQG